MEIYREHSGGAAWMTRRLPEVYLFVALMVCGLLVVVTGPFYIPDEASHAEREVQIAHGGMTGERTTQGVGGDIDTNLSMVGSSIDDIRFAFLGRYGKARRLPPGRLTVQELAPLAPLHWSGRKSFVDFQNTAVYPPGLYLPQALGWRIGEAADLTIVHSLMLARLCAAFSAIALGWLALRMAGQERWLIFLYLLLPSGLNLAASCSQDALLAPLASLIAVLLLRAVSQRRSLSTGELAVASCLLALISGARVTYLPLVFVLVLPEIDNGAATLRRLSKPLAAMALVVGVLGAWQLAVRHLGTLVRQGCDPAQQMALLKQHPGAGLESLVNGVAVRIPMMLIKGLYLLGYSDVGPPHTVYAVMVLGMAAFALVHPAPGLRSRRAKLVLVLAFAGVTCATWLAEYLIWTPVGANRVDGVQPRYLLPLLPLAIMLGWTWIPRKAAAALRPVLQSRVSFAAAAVFLPTVLYAPWVAAHVFYQMGLWPALRLGVQ